MRLLAAFFILAGLNHFLAPALYESLMPPYLPWHLPLIYISGLAEIAGGVGVLIPALRAASAWGLILLLVAVFPANIHSALNGLVLSGRQVPYWILLLRLPIQFVLIFWVYWSCLRRADA